MQQNDSSHEPRTSRVPVCAATTKAGNPCKTRILVDGVYCVAHSKTRGVDMALLGGRGGIASGEARREASKTVRDRLRERVEENVDLIWDAFESGLTSDDERTKIAAGVAVLAEAYGKTPQAIVGDPDQPVSFVLDSIFARAREEMGS